MNDKDEILINAFDMMVERLSNIEEKLSVMKNIDIWKIRHSSNNEPKQLWCGEIIDLPCDLRLYQGISQYDFDIYDGKYTDFYITLKYSQNIFDKLIYSKSNNIQKIKSFSKTILTENQYDIFWKHVESAKYPLLSECALTCNDIQLTPLRNYKYVDEYLVHQYIQKDFPYEIKQISFLNGLNFLIDTKETSLYPDEIVKSLIQQLLLDKTSLYHIAVYPLDHKYKDLYPDVFYSNKYYEYHEYSKNIYNKIKQLIENESLTMITKRDIETYFSNQRFSGLIDFDELHYILYNFFI